MPLDNTENFFREKLAELDGTLPPEVTWRPIQGWQELQPTLPAKRRRFAVWYQVAAVVAVLVASGLFVLNNKVSQTAITRQTTVAQQKPTPQLQAPLITKPGEIIRPKPAIATSNNKLLAHKNFKKQLKTKLNLPGNEASNIRNESSAILAPVIENTSTPDPENSLASTVEPDITKPAPIKITVVLGGKTSRQLAVYATENTHQPKQKKNRIKVEVNVPGEMLPDDTVLSATANHSPGRSALSARIDL